MTRGAALAASLPLAALTRAWQLLLTGLAEIRDASDPMMAAEMLLIRMAYGLSLPSTEDLAKLASASLRPAHPPERALAANPPPPSLPPHHRQVTDASGEAGPAVLDGRLALETSRLPPQPSQVPSAETFRHFRDVVRLVGEQRDVKLKAELERHVRPVRITPGTIEIALLPDAPPGLSGELARKLEAWTGKRFLILISKEPGEPPLREQAVFAHDRAVREARSHPAVKAVLDRFPGAEITAVRDFAPSDNQPGEIVSDPEHE
jgi:DNA polymerase-3 subunit gamma/tau